MPYAKLLPAQHLSRGPNGNQYPLEPPAAACPRACPNTVTAWNIDPATSQIPARPVRAQRSTVSPAKCATYIADVSFRSVLVTPQSNTVRTSIPVDSAFPHPRL